MPNVQASLMRNYESSRTSDFVQDMVDDIRKKKALVVRIHVAGDYYDVPYINKWKQIVVKSPTTRFFTYTRSWRLPKLQVALTRFAQDCPNLRMWWSLDSETGFPAEIPKEVRTAYMSVDFEDEPDERADLVFRDYHLRNSTQKRVNGVLVCPVENGVNKDLTCERCGVCWRLDKTGKHAETTKLKKSRSRIPLQLVG